MDKEITLMCVMYCMYCVCCTGTRVCVKQDLHANRGKKYPIGEDFAHSLSSLSSLVITTY